MYRTEVNMAISSIFGDPALTRQKTAAESGRYVLSEKDQVWLDSVYEKILVKMKAETERIGTMIPYSTRDGRYHDLDRPGGLFSGPTASGPECCGRCTMLPEMNFTAARLKG